MNEYIFYTAEGFTETPNSSNCENFHILGFVKANDEQTAFDLLIKENVWISDGGFSLNNILCRQILNSENKNDIAGMINYLWEDEKKHSEELDSPENHIFTILKRLATLVK